MDITTDDIQAFLHKINAHLPESIQHFLARYTPQQWIRLIIIVCGYMLLRPLLMKLGARQQLKAHERAEAEAAAAPGASLSPNDLRGQKLVMPEESDDDDDETPRAEGVSTATGPEWGKKARKRQRVMVKKTLEAHEKKLAEEQEDDEDKDIEEFLVD